ncbi:MAG: hypothetical protein M3534_06810 [Actinomycetota bacterium]|nr:hypothetical protein [Actinomycetota bacterium]
MRKLMVLATVLAMALVVASPAMANTSGIAGDVDGGFGNNGFGNNGFDDDFVFVNASQEQFALQVSTGDAIATGDGSLAFSSVDQSVDQSQFNAHFDGDSDDDGIFDEFDFVILVGDFDNNGIVDDFEF